MKAIRVIATLALAQAVGGCWSGVYDNPAAEYIHRTDTIATSAGNAKDINAAIEVVNPWPRRAADPRIPVNGERMAHAVEHYKSGQSAGSQSQSGPQVIGIPVGAATPTLSSGSATGTPTQ